MASPRYATDRIDSLREVALRVADALDRRASKQGSEAKVHSADKVITEELLSFGVDEVMDAARDKALVSLLPELESVLGPVGLASTVVSVASSLLTIEARIALGKELLANEAKCAALSSLLRIEVIPMLARAHLDSERLREDCQQAHDLHDRHAQALGELLQMELRAGELLKRADELKEKLK